MINSRIFFWNKLKQLKKESMMWYFIRFHELSCRTFAVHFLFWSYLMGLAVGRFKANCPHMRPGTMDEEPSFGWEERPGIEPDTSRLTVLRVEPINHWGARLIHNHSTD